MFRMILRSALLLTICAGVVSASQPGVAFPEKYRGWTHVKSAKGAAGLHHIYANEQAMVGYRTGTFPVGSIIAFDVLEFVDKEGTMTEGARVRLDVMQKNSGGDWQYGQFKKGDPNQGVTDEKVLSSCTTCHAKQKDHVISQYRN